MTETNPKLAKIKALLAKAEDPAASPEEAEAYFGRAADLMAKYGIDQALLAESQPRTDKITNRAFDIEGKYVPDRASLLFAITHALGAQNVYWNHTDHMTRKRYRTVRVYAHESTLDRIELLFASLQLQALNGVAKARPEWGESTTSYRKSWLAGFASSVRRRLEQAQETAVQESEQQGVGAELVLVKREEAVQRFFKQAHPKVKTAAPRRLSGSGWGDGRAAGDRADLGGRRIGGTRMALSR
ncbi:hypothetical protein SEA_JANUS_66 [Streptomyces phage Janus]|uniref:DUF2786 domain-containing protein n=1 Tax=Streptomyces phage Janus TaxID=2510525 RepID=A0A411CQC7_9CAUD|nr:hypothetical protein KGG75_gp66 [Streptomyces phage Janus]ATI18929.1 hypothetical protein SEA_SQUEAKYCLEAN_66 [Streptomyces phage SqueakyClean]QAY15970.1 hypothetical protein SEA_JANUS_66 [Streptomyces phage Janus]